VQTIYTGIIAAAALASGLAFGLGLRDEARDVLAGRAMAEQFRVGDEIAVGKLEGHIQRIGVIMTTVTRRDGSMVTIPNREMLDQRLTVAAGSRASSRLSVTFASAQHEAEGAAISPPHTHPSP
jgi:small-conductance mechanosensitive channel